MTPLINWDEEFPPLVSAPQPSEAIPIPKPRRHVPPTPRPRHFPPSATVPLLPPPRSSRLPEINSLDSTFMKSIS